MNDTTFTITLRVWRQNDAQSRGEFVSYQAEAHPNMSFLEMLDVLNDRLIQEDKEPIAFDYDCREGICGTCGLVIDGNPHGKFTATTTCQLMMRHYKEGDTITVEPWRATPFPIIKDLMVDRTAMDALQQAGGYVSMDCGSAPDANSLPIGKDVADAAMDAAVCIGCGACVASCKNASASLFVGAKIGQFSLLPQGEPERARRAVAMVERMDELGFGACTNEAECEAACPVSISTKWIHRMNREYTRGVREVSKNS